jgi:hypothetical protein
MKIEEYRGFYDIPRLFLASDGLGRFWIFDCPFDDVADDFPAFYHVVNAGTNYQEASAVFAAISFGKQVEYTHKAEIADVEFDETRRARMLCKGNARELSGHGTDQDH